jgi:endonuclease/exonuclease/phosphatase family metal-dependent hydrolase
MTSLRSLLRLLPALLSVPSARPAAVGFPIPPVVPSSVTVRVLTYNIHHGEGRDGRLDLVRTADVIRSANPDLVALQEVDRGTTRTERIDELAELARLLGMHAQFGKAMDYAGGEYGVAILSRWPIASADNQPLPHPGEHEPRTALTVRVRLGEDGPWVRFTSTHLDETREQEPRIEQARRLAEVLTGHPDGLGIVAGDFNARLETDAMQLLHAHWSNAVPEYPAPPAGTPGFGGFGGGPQPQQGGGPGPQSPLGPDGRPVVQQRRGGPRGDFVLFPPTGAWTVLESRAIDDFVASDHRPVLTVLEWAPVPSR